MSKSILNPKRPPYFPLFSAILILGGCSDEQPAGSQPEEMVVGEESMPAPAETSWPVGGELVYVSNEDSGNISIISTLDNQVVATMDVGRRPRGIRVAPGGEKVYVALW
jgi:YVTN family beta-propeller protein